jgi:hypothetical protein
MSPEQVRGQKADVRSDLYGLGATLYSLAAGRTLFLGETNEEIMVKVVKEAPTPLRKLNPKVSPAFATFVEKLIKKDPFERYQSALAAQEALSRLPLAAGANGGTGTQKVSTPVRGATAVGAAKIRRGRAKAKGGASNVSMVGIGIAATVVLVLLLSLFAGRAPAGSSVNSSASTASARFGSEKPSPVVVTPSVSAPVTQEALLAPAPADELAFLLEKWSALWEENPQEAAALMAAYIVEHDGKANAERVGQRLGELRFEAENRKRRWVESRTAIHAKMTEGAWAEAQKILTQVMPQLGKGAERAEAEKLAGEIREKIETEVFSAENNLRQALAAGDLAQAELNGRKLLLACGADGLPYRKAWEQINQMRESQVVADAKLIAAAVTETSAFLLDKNESPRFLFQQAAEMWKKQKPLLKTADAQKRVVIWEMNLFRAEAWHNAIVSASAVRRVPLAVTRLGDYPNPTVLGLENAGVRLLLTETTVQRVLPWEKVSAFSAAQLFETFSKATLAPDDQLGLGLTACFWRNFPVAVKYLRAVASVSDAMKEAAADLLVIAETGLEKYAETVLTEGFVASGMNDLSYLNERLEELKGDLKSTAYLTKRAADVTELEKRKREMERKKTQALAEVQNQANEQKYKAAIAELKKLGWTDIDGDWVLASGTGGVWQVNNGTLRANMSDVAVSLRFALDKPTAKDEGKTNGIKILVRYPTQNRELLQRFGGEQKIGEGYGIEVIEDNLDVYGPIFRRPPGFDADNPRMKNFVPSLPGVVKQLKHPQGQEGTVAIQVKDRRLVVTLNGVIVISNNDLRLQGGTGIIVKVEGGARISLPRVAPQ